VTEMKMALKQFLKNVDHGKNEIQLMRYIDFIKNELAIDNSLLIEDEEFRLIVDGINNDDQIEIIDRYNYGSELINLGRFKEALPILIEVEEMEDLDPWLFYNIGICYLKMEQMDKACEYFTKSGEYGERLEEKIKKLCNIE
jgi:tetratricopeptide (TPR) repeat protein